MKNSSKWTGPSIQSAATVVVHLEKFYRIKQYEQYTKLKGPTHNNLSVIRHSMKDIHKYQKHYKKKTNDTKIQTKTNQFRIVRHALNWAQAKSTRSVFFMHQLA